MSRYIDAEYCEDFFDRWESRVKDADPVTIDVVQNTRTLLRDAPSIDIEPKRGEWLIEKTLYDNYNYRCSYCDWYECHAYPDVEPYNFCPNCGARMKGADDE